MFTTERRTKFHRLQTVATSERDTVTIITSLLSMTIFRPLEYAVEDTCC